MLDLAVSLPFAPKFEINLRTSKPSPLPAIVLVTNLSVELDTVQVVDVYVAFLRDLFYLVVEVKVPVQGLTAASGAIERKHSMRDVHACSVGDADS